MAFLTEAANRGSISTGYEIDNSLKFEADNSEYLSFSNSVGENRRTWTYSTWIKKTELFGTGAVGGTLFGAYLSANDRTRIEQYADQLGIHGKISGTTAINVRTNRVLRDMGAWYHCMVVLDTTQSTETDRVKIYINGVQETSMVSAVYPPQNYSFALNNAVNHFVGQKGDGTDYFCGYMAETYFIDGQALTPTSFGEFDDSGIWIPIQFTGTYPSADTNHFYLNFDDSSNLGKDSSGNGKNMTSNNIAAADQATDTPTNNFCTLNPLSYNVPYTASQGNTKWSKSDTTYGMASGTQYVAEGKWYWEIKATDFGTYSSCSFGIIDAAKPTVDANERGYEDPSLSANDTEILAMSGAPNNWFMNSNSTIANNGSTNSVDYTFYEGDILAFALDMDNGGYWMGCSRYSGVNNGSFWVAPGGTTTSGSVATTDPTNGNYALVGDGGGTNNGTPNFNGGTINGGSLLTAGFTFVTPLLGAYHSNTTVTLEVNFGGFTSYGETGGYSDANGYGNFAYAVPSGYYALCTKNLAEYG